MDRCTRNQLEALFAHYEEHGCACRFSRFRAIADLDLGTFGWAASDTQALLNVFDERAKLEAVSSDGFSTTGTCPRCGAQVVRYGIPVFRDSFLERARITNRLLPDVGAATHGPIPLCGPIYAAAPVAATRNERQRIERSFARLSAGEWLEYMRALESR